MTHRLGHSAAKAQAAAGNCARGPINTMPGELLLRISEHLSRRDTCSFFSVGKGFVNICRPAIEPLIKVWKTEHTIERIGFAAQDVAPDFAKALGSIADGAVPLSDSSKSHLLAQLAGKLKQMDGEAREEWFDKILVALKAVSSQGKVPVLLKLNHALAYLSEEEMVAGCNQLQAAVDALEPKDRARMNPAWAALTSADSRDCLEVLSEIAKMSLNARELALRDVLPCLRHWVWLPPVARAILSIIASLDGAGPDSLAFFAQVLKVALPDQAGPALQDSDKFSFDSIVPVLLMVLQALEGLSAAQARSVLAPIAGMIFRMRQVYSHAVPEVFSRRMVLPFTQACCASQLELGSLWGSLAVLNLRTGTADPIEGQPSLSPSELFMLIERCAMEGQGRGQAEYLPEAFNLALKLPREESQKRLALLWTAAVGSGCMSSLMEELAVLACSSTVFRDSLLHKMISYVSELSVGAALPMQLNSSNSSNSANALARASTVSEHAMKNVVRLAFSIEPATDRRAVFPMLASLANMSGLNLPDMFAKTVQMEKIGCDQALSLANDAMLAFSSPGLSNADPQFKWKLALPLWEYAATLTLELHSENERAKLFTLLQGFASSAPRDLVTPLLVRLTFVAVNFDDQMSIGKVINLGFGLKPEHRMPALAHMVLNACSAGAELGARVLKQVLRARKVFDIGSKQEMLVQIARQLNLDPSQNAIVALLKAAPRFSPKLKYELLSILIEKNNCEAVEHILVQISALKKSMRRTLLLQWAQHSTTWREDYRRVLGFQLLPMAARISPEFEKRIAQILQ